MAELENGTSGLSLGDIKKTARAQVIPLIRNGIFNERDENGYPVNYPFISESMGASDTAYDYTNNEHQAVALQAAQESIVLLKNDNNILPLAKDANVAVAGPISDARFKTTLAVGRTPDLENAGLSIGLRYDGRCRRRYYYNDFRRQYYCAESFPEWKICGG